MKTKYTDKLAMMLLLLAGITIIILLAAFLIYILYKGLPVFSWNFLCGKSSDLHAGGGVGAQLFNSFYLLFLSLRGPQARHPIDPCVDDPYHSANGNVKRPGQFRDARNKRCSPPVKIATGWKPR